MDGFPGEIILVFGFLGLLMLGAALEDLKRYIIKKAHKGGKRKDMEIFKRLRRSDEEKTGKAVIKYIDGLQKQNRVLNDAKAYLQDDNCQLMRENRELKKMLENLQGEYELLEEENKHIHNALANALKANGQLKRQNEGKSIFTSPVTEASVKAGENNA